MKFSLIALSLIIFLPLVLGNQDLSAQDPEHDLSHDLSEEEQAQESEDPPMSGSA